MYGFNYRPLNFPINREKMTKQIKQSDFLIVNDTHCMIGLQYIKKEMDSPRIVFICIKPEFVFARNIATKYNKDFYYNKELANKLFYHYSVGDYLDNKYGFFEPIAKLYTRYYKKHNISY